MAYQFYKTTENTLPESVSEGVRNSNMFWEHIYPKIKGKLEKIAVSSDSLPVTSEKKEIYSSCYIGIEDSFPVSYQLKVLPHPLPDSNRMLKKAEGIGLAVNYTQNFPKGVESILKDFGFFGCSE